MWSYPNCPVGSKQTVGKSKHSSQISPLSHLKLILVSKRHFKVPYCTIILQLECYTVYNNMFHTTDFFSQMMLHIQAF